MMREENGVDRRALTSPRAPEVSKQRQATVVETICFVGATVAPETILGTAL